MAQRWINFREDATTWGIALAVMAFSWTVLWLAATVLKWVATPAWWVYRAFDYVLILALVVALFVAIPLYCFQSTRPRAAGLLITLSNVFAAKLWMIGLYAMGHYWSKFGLALALGLTLRLRWLVGMTFFCLILNRDMADLPTFMFAATLLFGSRFLVVRAVRCTAVRQETVDVTLAEGQRDLEREDGENLRF